MGDFFDEGPAGQNREMLPVKVVVQNKLPAMMKTLPKQMKERFQQAAMAVAMQPTISQCNPDSVASAVFACARLQVYPDPVLKQAYIVPFKGKATLILGYPGLIELARRACPGLQLHTGCVYANDDYRLTQGTHNDVVITRAHWQKGEEPGELVFAYCAYKTPMASGAETVIVPRYKLDAIADQKGNVWKSDFDSMAEKTAIRRAAKFWTLSADRKEDAERFREALAYDEADPDNLPVVPEEQSAELRDIAEGDRPIGAPVEAEVIVGGPAASGPVKRVKSREVQ